MPAIVAVLSYRPRGHGSVSVRHIVVVHAYNTSNLSKCREKHDLAMAVTMFAVACTESSQAVSYYCTIKLGYN